MIVLQPNIPYRLCAHFKNLYAILTQWSSTVFGLNNDSPSLIRLSGKTWNEKFAK